MNGVVALKTFAIHFALDWSSQHVMAQSAAIPSRFEQLNVVKEKGGVSVEVEHLSLVLREVTVVSPQSRSTNA